jgi:glycosyltransferase involved in cell wall biosynthesis
MTNPEVTVIVPVYNGAAYLAETINSLLSQTFGNFELLAIDDGSTDASGEIIRSFKDERVRLIEKKNGGLCEALNLGIAEAKAAFIARCDQDDISYPERLERQLQVMRAHPEALGLFAYSTKFGSKHGWSNADKMVMAQGEVKEYDPMADGCLLCSTLFAQTAALRSIGGFRQAYYPADDWDLECRLAEAGKVLILREPLIAYRFQTSANTYRVFAEMRNKGRWVKDSYRRRRQSLSELSFEQFMAAQPSGIFAHLSRSRKDAAKLHMRTAGQRYLDGQYVAGAVHLLAAALLKPEELAGRVRRFFVHS